MLGFPVHHQLPEPTQTQAHQVGDAIQAFLSSVVPSPPALNLSSIRVFSNEKVSIRVFSCVLSVHGTFQARVPEWGAIAFSD